MQNFNFSQEHADAQHGGEESENNLKHDWEDAFTLSNEIESIDVEEKGTYVLQGSLESTGDFAYDVPDMTVFNAKGKDGTITQLAASYSMVDSFEIDEDDETATITVYLKDYEPHSNPIPGVYIVAQDFPKELVF